MLKENPDLVEKRDACGATIIHIAYLFENYEIGRWLVKSFPKEALSGYSFLSDGSEHKNIVMTDSYATIRSEGGSEGSGGARIGHWLKTSLASISPFSRHREATTDVNVRVPHDIMPYTGTAIYNCTKNISNPQLNTFLCGNNITTNMPTH